MWNSRPFYDFAGDRDIKAELRRARAAAKRRLSLTYLEWRQRFPQGYPIKPGEVVEVGRADRVRPNYVKLCDSGILWCSCDEYKDAPAPRSADLQKECRHTRAVAGRTGRTDPAPRMRAPPPSPATNNLAAPPQLTTNGVR